MPAVRFLAAYIAVLAAVTLATGQYWLLPAGLAVVAAGMLLTSR
jgi:hypothetical protein